MIEAIPALIMSLRFWSIPGIDPDDASGEAIPSSRVTLSALGSIFL
jgi:hypothetical protein